MDIKLNKENGITLIALVVTIVVLLILAGVSISMLTGENGIITQAQNSKEETRGGAVEEARDLWRADKQTDKLTNSDTAQTLDELLDDLVEDKLLSEEEKEEIKETGEVTIGSRTIDFDLTQKLDVYASVRAFDSSGIYETQIVYEIKLPLELIEEAGIGITFNEVMELEENLEQIANGDSDNMTVEEKEQMFNQMLYIEIYQRGLDLSLEETINIMAKELGITEECSTLEELYDALKNSNIVEDNFKDLTYDEFLYYLIKESASDFMVALQYVFYDIVYNKELSFQYIITKPDGTKIEENINVNSQYSEEQEKILIESALWEWGSEYEGLWFAIKIPVEEYGEYKMTIKSLETEYEGIANIEYTDSRYLVTYGITVYLYDLQLKEKVNIDEVYMCYNDIKTDIRDRIYNEKRIYLYELQETNTPYEIEFIKNGEKIRIPVLIVKEAR